MTGSDMVQFSTLVIVSLLVAFYGGTFLISLRIGKKQENADGFMNRPGKQVRIWCFGREYDGHLDLGVVDCTHLPLLATPTESPAPFTTVCGAR